MISILHFGHLEWKELVVQPTRPGIPEGGFYVIDQKAAGQSTEIEDTATAKTALVPKYLDSRPTKKDGKSDIDVVIGADGKITVTGSE